MDNYNELKESLNLMLMQCDGTVTTDEMGFNRYDAPFARDLARRPEWSPRQAQAVHKMLRKYKTQLEHHGVNFDAIPMPTLKDAPARVSRNDIRKASLNEDRIVLSFRLSSRSEFESELAEIRAIPGRQYHENLKAWSIPINNYSIDKIDSMSYEIDPAILKWKEENDKPKAKLDIPQNVKLYPFQEEGVQMLEQLNGRALLADEQGCIDGEAIISISRGGGTKKIKLKDAYLRFNNIAPRKSDNWNRETTTYTRCDKMGRIGLHPIKEILFKGERECLYIKTKSGKELRLTPDHEVLTEKGWKPIASVKKGDYIFVNGKNICPDCGTDKNIITYPYSKFKGYCKNCMYKKLRANKNKIDHKRTLHKSDGYVYLRGSDYHNHPRYTRSGLLEHIYLMEKHIGRSINKDEEVHHIDGNRSNNAISNLKLMTKSGHKKEHKIENNFKNFTHRNGSKVITVPQLERIITKRKIGKRPVYDIVMDDPFRNFIANGIIVHNCGKTCQVICWMKSHPELRPAIIIVPASLKINWTREFKKWGCDEKITVINGTSFPMSMNEKLVVVNYDVIGSYIEIFEEMKFKLMVCDESHAIKNSKANRTRAVKYLAKDIPHIICISGTPIINRPIEFYTTLNLLMPKMFNSKNRFIEEYCGGFAEGGKGASNTIRLNEILSKSFMIRRLKKDVLKELPDKQISIVPMEISNRKVYKRAEEDFINWLAETEGDEKAMRAMTAETLVRMEKLKQLSVEGKMEQVIEWIQDIFDQDEKLVVFCTHHSAIDKLMETFKDVAVKLDGRTTQADRQKAVDAFQEDEKVRLFIGNIKAAGTGITLTAASIAAFVEFPWAPGDIDQASDRIHRISQKEAVNIYYLVGMDTIEDDMALLLDSKRQILTAILNGEAPEDQSLVWELIQQYKNKGR